MTETRLVNVGDAMPDITFPHLDGRQVALSEFAGSRLIVFMWASW
jgi:peroxiredoxin